jgi:hypothetical protein
MATCNSPYGLPVVSIAGFVVNNAFYMAVSYVSSFIMLNSFEDKELITYENDLAKSFFCVCPPCLQG